MNVKRTHYATGLVITVFVALHLFNHACSLLSIEKHIEVMTSLRSVYRNIFIEIILLSAVCIQIFTGISLFKRNRKIVSTPFEKLQLWSGLYIAIFFLIHVSAVIGGRLILQLDTNFYFGVAGLNSFPANLFFIPYYGLAIFSFFGHIASIHSKKMTRSIFGVSPTNQSVIILILAVVFIIVLFFGLTNHFNGVIIPQEYKILIGQ